MRGPDVEEGELKAHAPASRKLAKRRASAAFLVRVLGVVLLCLGLIYAANQGMLWAMTTFGR